MPSDSKAPPAHKGARFDVHGHCLAHPDVRLCRLTHNGQYKIVRKTCFKCGSAAFMTDGHAARTSCHGYKKRGVERREVPGELFDHHRGGKGSQHQRERRRRHREEGDDDDDECRSLSPLRGHRRARTLSPRRRLGSEKSPRKAAPRSTSHLKPKKMVSSDVLKNLLPGLRPPFATGKSQGSEGRDKDYARPHEIPHNLSAIPPPPVPPPPKMSEGVGLCRLHPEVSLAIRRTERGDGTWTIQRDNCPLCCARTSHNEQHNGGFKRSSNRRGSASKAVTVVHRNGNKEEIDLPASPSPSPKSPRAVISDEYFARALVIYDGDQKKAEANNEGHTKKSLLPNSAARIARREKRRKERAWSRPKAVDVWDALPVY